MNTIDTKQHTGDEIPSPVSLKKRLMRFMVVVFLVAGILYLAPNLERLPGGVGHTISVLRESGIEVGAWYWDDVDQCFEGMDFIREKREKE
jgi:hypothetical protein